MTVFCSKRAPNLHLVIFLWLAVISEATLLSAQQPNDRPGSSPGVRLSFSDDKTPAKKDQATDSQFDGEAAFTILEKICEIGPRVSGTPGMKKQQEFIKKHFQSLNAEVSEQVFTVRHPERGTQVPMANLIARFHPERRKRLLFCCHYDTRPFADRDPVNPNGIFIGANDGASGVGLLCELARHVEEMPGKYGIDFVFFDGEEFVYVYRRDPMFLGSTYFARQYAARRYPGKVNYAILVDMIGDKELEIYYEGNSLEMASRLTRSIWSVANEMGVKEFSAKERHKIRDDHLPLNAIARIPTCDIIDFDYPRVGSENMYWHTQQDIPENCSAQSLDKVGRVLLEWLKQMQKIR